MKIYFLLFSICVLFSGCSVCQPVTHLKKTLINIPKEVKPYRGANPTHNLFELKNGTEVSYSWKSGVKYGSYNLTIVVFGNPKKISPSFETDKMIELDENSLIQTNTFQIPKFIPIPAQPSDGYLVTIETESYLEANPKTFKIPKLIINDQTYVIPDIKIMKATEELCFRPGI